MNGDRQTWSITKRGSSLATLRRDVARDAQTALAAKQPAKANVLSYTVTRPEPGLFEMTFAVEYWRDVTLKSWIDAALGEAKAELGPGMVRLPEAAP